MLLSLLVFLPFLLGILVLLMPESMAKAIRLTTFLGSSAIFLLSLGLIYYFDLSTPYLQMVEKYEWIKEFGIHYYLGVDGISLWLVLLTTFLTPITVLGSWKSIDRRVKEFHFCLLLLESAMIGSFLAVDAILFYVFFEASLIPMYFIVGIWGGERRIYASMKFFIYTMLGSLMMLAAIIYLMYAVHDSMGYYSTSLEDFYRLNLPFVGGSFWNPQAILFFAFSLAFAIKVPMFPLHTWLPDAHVEAPTPGSVLLAGVMLKMGTYGFVRFVLPLFPEAVSYWGWLFLFLGVVGIVYGALVAMVQPDIKKLVAYSSVSHMGYVMLGIFALNTLGLTGGLYQMLNHGVSTGALFLLVGMIYERTHSRMISKYGGLARALPWFTIFFLIVTLSSIAVPMTNGFVGEFLILLGTYKTDPVVAAIAVSGVVLGAAYMLWMVKRVFYGPAGELVGSGDIKDLCPREIAVMLPLLALIFWMGLWPNHFLKYSEASVQHLINNRDHYHLVKSSGAEVKNSDEESASLQPGQPDQEETEEKLEHE